MMHSTTEDYSGRQVDLEVLKSVVLPVDEYEMALDTSTNPKQVAGVQKAIQRYVSLLLSPGQSVRFGGDQDNMLLSQLHSGLVSDTGYLQHLFNMANAAALDAMERDDYNTDKFGPTRDDERIAEVDLSNISLDYVTSTISLSLTFTTAAGTGYEYVVPVGAAKRL